jgi:hypothetical protein
MADLETAVDNWITSHSTFQITETRIIHGNGNATQLKVIGRQISELTQEHYVRGIVHDDFHEVMGRLQAEFDRLSAMERYTDHIEEIDTGRYLSEEWSRWDEQKRRRYLIEHDFRFYARRNAAGDIVLDARPRGRYATKQGTVTPTSQDSA